MIELSAANVRLHGSVANKTEAIRAVGQLLVEGGYIAPEYIDSMLGRERQANTYLGNGIAIPHGMGQDRGLIRRTGVAVLQVPEGVAWNAGETVRLVVGIAARSDEHLQVLANLTDVLDDPRTAERLARTDDAAQIVASLSRTRSQAVGAPAPLVEYPPGARVLELPLRGAAGLHARPASAFVETAGRFESEIRVEHNGSAANGKALAALLRLGVEGGQTIRIAAWGPDADAALAALRAAVEQGLGERDEPEQRPPALVWAPVSDGPAVSGVAAAPGLAIGPVYRVRRARISVSDTPQDAESELQRLRQATAGARSQLNQVYEEVRARSGSGEAAIFRAHQALLDDPELSGEVRAQIAAGHSAAWAWQQAIEARAAELGQVRDERLAGRAADMRDVGERVLRLLVPGAPSEPDLPDTPVILLADDLAPSDTARLDPRRTLGLATAGGGPTSHTAIIARSLGIPAVVGAGPALLELADGAVAILDGGGGRLYSAPSEADLAAAREFQAALQQQQDAAQAARYQPALLRDGARVEVVANIGRPADAAQAVEAGAEGVGLLRTEFLFLDRETAPDEEEQYLAYTTMLRALNGLPLIIRTLDIGGDKAVPYLDLPPEQNPFLGMRGIRLCLRRPDLFVPQLRAIYRAASVGPLSIMFPMVATLEELRAARTMAEQVRQELGAPQVEIGIMVEVPAAVLMASELAREVDFFSIGTNDLAQYALAIDRQHPALASQADGLHPAVLRLIAMTVQAAQAAGRWVGVCGGLAGDERGALILAGLGVSELSVSIPSVPQVKAALRQVSLGQAQELAHRALACDSTEAVRALPLP
jgi:phosphocarrier protein FPr